MQGSMQHTGSAISRSLRPSIPAPGEERTGLRVSEPVNCAACQPFLLWKLLLWAAGLVCYINISGASRRLLSGVLTPSCYPGSEKGGGF